MFPQLIKNKQSIIMIKASQKIRLTGFLPAFFRNPELFPLGFFRTATGK
jgi:hypothetical protein